MKEVPLVPVDIPWFTPNDDSYKEKRVPEYPPNPAFDKKVDEKVWGLVKKLPKSNSLQIERKIKMKCRLSGRIQWAN